MLLLTRKLEESLLIGNNVEIKVLAIQRGHVTLGITAPTRVPVHRREVYDAIHAINRAASAFHPRDLDNAAPRNP